MPLTANFIADFSSFINACASATASTAEVEAAGDRLAGSFNQSVQAAAGSLQSVGTGIADFGKKAWSVLSGPELAEFGHAVTDFAGDYIRDFAKAEQATVRLEQALKNSGESSPAVGKAYADMAEGLEKISTFSHVAITNAQAIFTTIGEVGPANMQKALEAAMNLAAFMGTDVVTAAKLMQKAAESNGEAVGRLKVFLGSAYEKGMDFNTIVDLLAKKFDGQFAAALNTTAGHLQNMQNQMDGVNEKIGKDGAAAVNLLIDAFHKLPEGMQTFIIASDSIANKAGPVASAFGNLAQVLGTLFPAAMVGAGAALVGFGETILAFVAGAGALLISLPGLIIAGFTALDVAIYKYRVELRAALQPLVTFLLIDLPEAFTKSIDAVGQWFAGMKHWLQDELGSLIDWVVNRIPDITNAFKRAAETIVFHSIVPDMVNGIADQFGRLQSVMVAPAVAASQSVTKTFDELWTSASSVMNFLNPLMFAGITMPSQAVKFANVFSSTSGLTETAPGTVITLNMTGMLGTDDPQTRAQISSIVSDAVMQGMRSGRLLGTA